MGSLRTKKERLMRGLHENFEALWRGVVLGIGVSGLMDGAVYLIFGNAAAAGPSSSLLRHAPYGLRSVGLLMFVVAVGVLCTAAKAGKAAQAWLFIMFVVGMVITCYTIGGWVNADQVAAGALSKWLLLSWLSLWLAATARRGGGSKDVATARRRSK